MGRHYDRARWLWVLAALPPALFVLFFLVLTVLADPQHDDFCFSYRFVEQGLISIRGFYGEVGGRIVPYGLIDVPAAISQATGISLLSAYSLTMATGAVAFLAGCMAAVARAWPRIRGLPSIFLGLVFAAAVLGASTSVRDLLYWLPGVACYVPPAIACILILAECLRALDGKVEFSTGAILCMAAGGFVAALCNEFTAIWLVAILVGSTVARRMLEQKMQIGAHALIAIAVTAGWVVVVAANGNTARMAHFTDRGHIGHSLLEALRFSMVQLGQFLREPAVIAWLVAVAALTYAIPNRSDAAHPRARFLAPGIIVLCLACCYFEYFVHYYSTGIRLVERAQNQALILLLFGSGLFASLLVRTYRSSLERMIAQSATISPLSSGRLPVALACLVAALLLLSKTAFLVYAEGSSLYPYWRETVARHRLLTTSSASVVTVPKHRWTPSLLLSADVMVNTGCIARYFGKAELIVVEPPAD